MSACNRPASVGTADTAFLGPNLNTDPSLKSTDTMTITAGPAGAGGPASCNAAAAGRVVGDLRRERRAC